MRASAGDPTVGVALEEFLAPVIARSDSDVVISLTSSTTGSFDYAPLAQDDSVVDTGSPQSLTLLRDDSIVGSINVLISRRNKSVTVETVEAQITERIADMEIEDEVQIMLSQAIDNYDLVGSTETIVNEQIAELDTILSVEFSAVDSQITNLASNLDNLIERVVITENGLELMSNTQLLIIDELAMFNEPIF
jgi:hypothetical protein